MEDLRNSRLETRPGEQIDRSQVVDFEFDGQSVRGFKGDTIASALFAGGQRVFSRSFKYHRPRGLLCCSGNCPNCLVTVGDEPNVRSCTRAIEPGLQVHSQNAWPSLRFDLLSILDRMHWLMPVGFYYKALHRPKALWLLARQLIRRVGGLGSIDINATHHDHFSTVNRHADVVVVGGGPAGMAAAVAAADGGAGVMLIDDQPTLGGHLRYSGQIVPDPAGGESRPAVEIVRAIADAVSRSPNVEVLNDATVFGLYQDRLVAVLTGEGVVRVRAKQVVLATGSQETPLLFENNDLPGIMLSSAARRLIALYGIRPGRRAVIGTETEAGYEAALELLDAGVQVAAVLDSSGAAPGAAADAVRARGVTVLQGHQVIKAVGRGRVRAAVVAPADSASGGSARRIRCDLLCMSGEAQPVDALLHQMGASQTGVTLTGQAGGAAGLAEIVRQGREAGQRAAAAPSSEPEAIQQAHPESVEGEPAEPLAATVRLPSGGGERTYVCFCEDVSAHDIDLAIDEGFADVQILKRYTTVTMGPCQGKMCGRALAGMCAAATRAPSPSGGGLGWGSNPGDTYTTFRPPYQPVTLAALAGRERMPFKRTSLDRVHRDLGARMVESGPWLRPHSYGSPAEECVAVREWVGIIDVGTLGKLEVLGGDSGQLLDRLYTHRFSDLPVGRIRYGLMTSDNGVILDDGTVARLAEDRYFVTTTSGNADIIEEWFNWWNAGAGNCAHVVNVTSAFGAVNVAGPRARETLTKLTDINLSPRAFRYMRSAQGEVAGVPCLLLRIGFVGEAGWEVHFPAEYGEHMWRSIMDAGEEFGISPFGLEAQRILRLERGHVIVGQDTDAVSTPMDVGSDWAVRFDKPDFIGRGGLAIAAERGLQQQLVGFVMPGPTFPEDGTPVLSGARPVGRVTSARLSPTLGRGFGLAFVPPYLAVEGETIQVLVADRPVAARVTLEPVYDPEGLRLRS